MYSRYYGKQGEKVRLPENYSGCAFSKDNATDGARTPHPPPPLPHDPSPLKMPPPDPPAPPPPPLYKDAEALATDSPPSSPPPLPPSGGLLPKLNVSGTELDTLLILGLILLLLHNGEDTEIVLWLLLLLLY